MKTRKFAIAVILSAVSLAAGISAEVTPGDVREAVIAALGKDSAVECRIGPGGAVVWHNARERTVQVPAGKAAGMGTRGDRMMVPETDGWVVVISGPFDHTKAQKEWFVRGNSSSGAWNETWDVDGKGIVVRQAERFLVTEGPTTGYGLFLTCGASCDPEVARKFRELTIDQVTRVRSDSLQLDCPEGFRSLCYLFNRGQWDELPKSLVGIRHDSVTAGLDNPRQAVLLHNAWSLPYLGGRGDVRLTDLRKNALRRSLRFVKEWPAYELPGYIAAVLKRDGSWALVAEMGDYFFIEDNNAIGVVRREPR